MLDEGTSGKESFSDDDFDENKIQVSGFHLVLFRSSEFKRNQTVSSSSVSWYPSFLLTSGFFPFSQMGDLKVKTNLADICLCLYEKKTPQLQCVMKNLAVGYSSKPLQAVTT